MIESFQENSVYWILGTTLIALGFTVVGFLTGKNLPPKQRKTYIRKHALVGVALVFFCLPFFKPFVSSHSRVESLDELKAENLGSVEDIAKFEKQQTRNIERLKQEVIELKEDTYRMNSYYSIVVKLLSTIIAMGALSFAFRKEEKETGED